MKEGKRGRRKGGEGEREGKGEGEGKETQNSSSFHHLENVGLGLEVSFCIFPWV